MGVPHYFFKEGSIIPKIKERNQTDKVKGKGKKKDGGAAQQQAKRVMTAKLKKELAQQKRGGGSSGAEILHDDFTGVTSAANTVTGSASADSSAGAVEQVEQTTGAAVTDVGRYAKRGAAMAVSKAKKERRKIKERREQPDTQGQHPDTSAPPSGTHGADTPADDPAHHGQTDVPTTSQVPAPGDRMRQRAVNQRRGQLAHSRADTATQGKAPASAHPRADTPTHPGQTGTPATPQAPAPGDRMRQRAVDQRKEQLAHPNVGRIVQGEAPASPHYGKPASTPGPSTKNLPAGDPSIHPSIKERSRRSTVLKEKPQARAIRPKTRQAVTEAARTRAAPASTSGPMGKKASTKRLMERGRRKAQREAQRTMLQKSRQTAQAAADLSKRAAQGTVKAVKELISALAALVRGGTLAAAKGRGRPSSDR